MGNIFEQIRSQSGSDLMIPWAEYISKEGWTQDVSLGAGESRATMQIMVLWSDLDEAIREIVGYAKKVPGTTGLTRQIPMRHPRWYWMRAEKISSIKGLSFTGKGRPEGGPTSDTSEYKIAVLTVLFQTPNYAVRRDDQMGGANEWNRFVHKDRKSSVEVIMPEQGSLKFVEGPAAVINQAFRGNRGQRLLRTRLIWKWIGVPDDGLFTLGGMERGGRPAKIEAAVGKVNSAIFAGYEPGTLLFDAPEFTPVMYPVAPGFVMAKDYEWDVPRLYNVTLNFIHFDPPYDSAGGFTNRGHNLAPSPVNGKWYKVGVAGNASLPLYDSIDFATVFEMNVS